MTHDLRSTIYRYDFAIILIALALGRATLSRIYPDQSGSRHSAVANTVMRCSSAAAFAEEAKISL